MAKVIEANNPHTGWDTMSMRTAATIFIYGFGVGIVSYLAYLLLERFVFDPILCRQSVSLLHCESAPNIASGMAIVIGSFVGLVLLVRERVYRPILAILGVAVSLWGIFVLLANLPILLAVLVGSLLFATAYVLFSWLVQPTSLAISIACVVVVTVFARLALG